MNFIKLSKSKIIGIVIAILIIIISFIFLRDSAFLYFIFGIALFIGGLPFFISLIIETNSTREKNEMFLEFSRDLVEGVRSGTPIGKSILNTKSKNYGSLKPYVIKLANQISLGIPIQSAFETFARDIGSKTISRAITIISESQKAGGEIEDILESVSSSVAQTEKLRKERRAALHTLVVQGYIIFIIFIAIMLVMQFKILPIASDLGAGTDDIQGSDISSGTLDTLLGGENAATPEELARPFIWLLVIQGFFAGLVIGKLSEGSIKSGLKHSFILVILSFWINAGANLLFG